MVRGDTSQSLDEVEQVVVDSIDTAASWRIAGRDRAAAADLQVAASKVAILAFGKAKAAGIVGSPSVRRSSSRSAFEVPAIRTTSLDRGIERRSR